MKKIAFASAMLFLGLASANAQRIQNGDTQLNAGVGVGNSFGSLPIYAGIEYGLNDDVTIGGEVGFATQKTSNNLLSSKIENTSNLISVAAIANYHFNTLLNIPNNFDVYAGVSLGYNHITNNTTGLPTAGTTDVSSLNFKASSVGFAGQVGARYYFTDNFAVNAEFGGGNFATGGKVGISYKF